MSPVEKAVLAAQLTFGGLCLTGAGLGVWMNITLPWWGLLAVFAINARAALGVGRGVYAAHTEWER